MVSRRQLFAASEGRAPLQALADLVRGRMRQLDVNAYDVARRSQGAVSKSTVWNVTRLRVRGVHRSTIEGLTRGLDLAPAALEEAIRADRPHVARRSRRFVGLPEDSWEAIEGEARGADEVSAVVRRAGLGRLFRDRRAAPDTNCSLGGS